MLTSLIPGMLLSLSSIAVEPPASVQTPKQTNLTKLLKGNTLIGFWAGRPFRQYFSESGSTKYKEDNGSVSFGRWRVNSDGQYCSVWPPSPTEVCYDVLVDGIDIYWKSGGEVYPSTVTVGDVF